MSHSFSKYSAPQRLATLIPVRAHPLLKLSLYQPGGTKQSEIPGVTASSTALVTPGISNCVAPPGRWYLFAILLIECTPRLQKTANDFRMSPGR